MNFSKEYRTARNIEGKECIVVFGGDVDKRFSFAYWVRRFLPIGIEAYVFEQETKRLPRESGDCAEVFYIDLNRKHLDPSDKFYGQGV